MTRSKNYQQGVSAIVLLIVLAIIGVGVYVGFQYIPQQIESGKLDSILANIEKTHEEKPFGSRQELDSAIDRQLEVNEMNDMKSAFTVTQEGRSHKIKVHYERELNLLYEKRPMVYEKILILE